MHRLQGCHRYNKAEHAHHSAQIEGPLHWLNSPTSHQQTQPIDCLVVETEAGVSRLKGSWTVVSGTELVFPARLTLPLSLLTHSVSPSHNLFSLSANLNSSWTPSITRLMNRVQRPLRQDHFISPPIHTDTRAQYTLQCVPGLDLWLHRP